MNFRGSNPVKNLLEQYEDYQFCCVATACTEMSAGKIKVSTERIGQEQLFGKLKN